MIIKITGIQDVDGKTKVYFDIDYNGEIYHWADFAKGTNMSEFEEYIQSRKSLYKRYIDNMESDWLTCPKTKITESIDGNIEVEVKKEEIVFCPPIFLEDIIMKHVQEILDKTAQTRYYTDMFALVSYYNSSNPVFKAEAEAGIAWRDAMWLKCLEIQTKNATGELNIRTLEEFDELLPKIDW